MNFNLYLEEELAQKLRALSRSTGKSRNALIREAVQLLITKKQKAQWSPTILNIQGVSDSTDFETYREELLPPKEDGVI
jgi:metal-responsive CopG/Arc/MetJ family transcriptional regulator